MKITKFIANNRENFQMNFGLLKPKKISSQSISQFGRQLNIDKYGTNTVIVTPYYKKISRLL